MAAKENSGENAISDTPNAPPKVDSTNVNESCVFCQVLKGTSPGNILFSDEQVFCIRDIRPASTHHILVLPKNHLPNASQLTRDQLPLVSHMEEVGLQVAEKQGCSLVRDTITLGYHWGAFSSQSHLHLHVISPNRQMSWISKFIFWPGTYWFVSSQWLRNRLENLQV